MSNKRKTFWCKIFGCHVPTGYNEYFRVELGAVDGVGRHHARIVGRCERCESNVTIGNFHTHADGHLYRSKESFSRKINLKNMKTEYVWKIDGKVLFIEDLDRGKSVTNDIENVLAAISKSLVEDRIAGSVSNFDVIYRDTENNIDGVFTKDGKFVNFYYIGETDYYKAKLKTKRLDE